MGLQGRYGVCCLSVGGLGSFINGTGRYGVCCLSVGGLCSFRIVLGLRLSDVPLEPMSPVSYCWYRFLLRLVLKSRFFVDVAKYERI